MAKLTLTDLSSLANQTAAITLLNANWALIETALENTLSRDGTSPNTMSADLDMNSNNIINLPAAASSTEPIRKAEFDTYTATVAGSVSAAASSATAAANSATAAATSATAAATSATSAASSATSAATSNTNAGLSELAAAGYASTASTQASNASASAAAAQTAETNAETAETNAETAETNAATSATNAATSATNAATSATAAAASATSASTSATQAASSATAAASSYDSFDDRYLGAKASDPTLDNDGDALLTGALYWNTTVPTLKVYDGASWITYSALATRQLDNLTSVAINAALLPGTTNTIALGSVTKNWSDAYFGSGAVIDWNNDVTLTHATNALQLRTGSLNTLKRIYGRDIFNHYRGDEWCVGSYQTDVNTDYGLQFVALGANTYAVWNDFFKSRSTDGNTVATVIAGDEIIRFNGLADNGNATLNNNFLLSGTLKLIAESVVASTAVYGQWQFSTYGASGHVQQLTIESGGNVRPGANDRGSLGISGTAWSDLFLASGAVINFNAGDVTITHSANSLTLAGGILQLSDNAIYLRSGGDTNHQITYDGTVNGPLLRGYAAVRLQHVDPTDRSVELKLGAWQPVTTDTVTLGTSSLMWSDLFLASGAVINFAAGDFNITHSSGQLDVGFATFDNDNGFGNRQVVLTAATSTAGSFFKFAKAAGNGTVSDYNGGFGMYPRMSAGAEEWGGGIDMYTGPNAGDNVVATISTEIDIYWRHQGGYRGIYFFGNNMYPETTDTVALGTSSRMFSDLFLASGAVINFNAGDVTLTHSSNALTLAGGSLVLPDTGLTVGASVPFSDSSGTLTLQNVDALDATTEATIEAAIDTLANLTSIQGRTVTLADAGANAIFGWDDTAGAYENLSAAEATAVLNNVVGDSGSGGTKGLVPAPAAGDAAAGKFLKADGAWTAIPGGGDALTSSSLAQFAATTSAQLAGVISDETGSGALVFANTPTLVTPVLGTPTSGTLTNCTGLPVDTGISGLASGIAAWLADPTSAKLATAVTNETGSGALMFATSPTITTDITIPNTGLHILDTNASHDLIIAPGSDLSADHTLTLTTGDADRTITINGNVTLNDWFDQAVKAASSPTFAAITATSSIKSSSATAGVGYATGAGGTVTQLTSKTTGVELNKICGQIVTHDAALAAGSEVSFTVTNSTVAATDCVIVNLASSTADKYAIWVDGVSAGSFRIGLSNVSGTSGSTALTINFAVIKAVTS